MARYVALVKVIIEADNEEDANDLLDDSICMVDESDLGQNVTFVVENDLIPVD